MPTDRSQPRPRRQEACSSEGCASDIGRIVQHAADRGCMPICRALPGPTAHLLQTAAYCAQAQSIQTDPCKDASNDVRLRFHHLETRHSAALTPAHVAVRHVGGRAVRAPEFWLVHIRRSRLEPGARDHPPRCRRSDVQENNLRARAVKLIDQQHLMDVTAGESVRSVDIDALDRAASNCIPQALQRRAK